MFGLSPWHLAVLVVVALIVFGPDRLPGMIKELGKALRQVRATAQTMQDELKSELGPEVGDLDLRSLHPRAFVEKHLFGDDDIEALKKVAEPLTSLTKDDPEPSVAPPLVAEPVVSPPSLTKTIVSPSAGEAVADHVAEPDVAGSAPKSQMYRFDIDAT